MGNDLEKVESAYLKKLILEKSITCSPTTTPTRTTTSTETNTQPQHARKRAGGRADARGGGGDGKEDGLQKSAGSQSAAPHPVDPENPKTKAFAEFWEKYPKKAGRPAAAAAFAAVQDAEYPAIMLALEWQRTLPQWTKEGGRYVPSPVNWLLGERWKDERPAASPSPQSRHNGFGGGQYQLGSTATLLPGNRVVFKPGFQS